MSVPGEKKVNRQKFPFSLEWGMHHFIRFISDKITSNKKGRITFLGAFQVLLPSKSPHQGPVRSSNLQACHQ